MNAPTWPLLVGPAAGRDLRTVSCSDAMELNFFTRFLLEDGRMHSLSRRCLAAWWPLQSRCDRLPMSRRRRAYLVGDVTLSPGTGRWLLKWCRRWSPAARNCNPVLYGEWLLCADVGLAESPRLARETALHLWIQSTHHAIELRAGTPLAPNRHLKFTSRMNTPFQRSGQSYLCVAWAHAMSDHVPFERLCLQQPPCVLEPTMSIN
mmetsp:Transcript_23949/g.51646  ORF Transcript_23949/g.51646 Transcript_23949/m.51646 type:complete len:206 (+) Transcript_23949:90-707(+)